MSITSAGRTEAPEPTGRAITMLAIRRGDERGHFNHGWLDTHHTFSFSRYHDPRYMGFRALRVINEDRVHPGQGFGTHGHEDMEILTYVLEGQLAHQDSLGHTETLRPGEFQRMTAGTGLRHSEFNPSPAEPVHFYQIWIEPDRAGHTPGYEQKRFDDERTLGRLAVVASPDGRDGSLTIQQDATVLLGRLAEGESARADLAPGRGAWVQVLRGRVALDGQTLEAGDGAALEDLPAVVLRALEDAEVMVFDLA